MSIYIPLVNEAGTEKLEQYLSNLPNIEAEVVFGVFSNNCAGNGICSVTPKNIRKKRPCTCFKADARIYNYFNQLLFSFKAQQIAPVIKEKYFATDFFLQEEALKIDLFLLEKIDLQRFTILSGQHQVWKMNYDYLLLFNHDRFI